MRKRRTPNAQRPMGNRIICWQPWLRQRSCRSAYHRAKNPARIEAADRRMLGQPGSSLQFRVVRA